MQTMQTNAARNTQNQHVQTHATTAASFKKSTQSSCGNVLSKAKPMCAIHNVQYANNNEPTWNPQFKKCKKCKNTFTADKCPNCTKKK
jgi:hypothetical protein